MVSIILASHGNFAEGLLQSAQMIFGDQSQLMAVTLPRETGPDKFKADLDTIVETFGADAEVLFLVDLWGGTPFNQVNIVHETMVERSAIISGMNLPMLLEALGQRDTVEKATDLARLIISKDARGIRVKPQELDVIEEKSLGKTNRGAVTLEPGTVLGEGKIEYVLTRVDTRLLHGQVATNWVKSTNPTRIIVVSDTVAHDEMRKSLIQEATPPGVRSNVIPIEKLAEIDKDPRFGKTRALLLFETPQDVLRAVELGVEFDEINLGSMAHSKNKTMISNSMSVDQDDVDTLRALNEKGITFDVRKVPADSPEDLEKLLRKHNLV